MSIIVDIDHEGGDLSEYTATVTDSGDLSVASAAALASSDYGLSVAIDDTTVIYAQYDLGSADTSGTWRFRFYIDPNTITMGNNETFALIYGFNSSVQLTLTLDFKYLNASGYQIRVGTYNDAGSASNTSYYGMTDAPHYVEIALVAGAGSGSLALYIDGSLQETISSIDNDTRAANHYRWRWGALNGIDVGTSGTFYLDELVINNDGSEIGPVSSGVSVTPAAISSTGSTVNPTVQLGNISLTPTAISSMGSVVAPAVQLGNLSIEPTAISATAGTVDPTVQVSGGGITVTPDAISAPASVVAPTIILGSLSYSPAAIAAVGSAVDPTVELGSLSIEPGAISAAGTIFDPTVRLGSLNVSPGAISAAGTIFDPTVRLGSLIITPTSIAAVSSVVAPTVLAGGNADITPDAIAAWASVSIGFVSGGEGDAAARKKGLLLPW